MDAKTNALDSNEAIQPTLTAEELQHLENLHQSAKGAPFDLVPEDGPIARLVLALSGPSIAEALFAMARTHLKLLDVLQNDGPQRHHVAQAICTAIGDDWDREGHGEGGERLTGYDDLAIAAAKALLTHRP